MLDLASWPLTLVIGILILAAGVITAAGTRLARVSDRLADVTGLGEAVFGAVLLGGSTSLPGIVTSVVVAYQGYGELAVSNAIGGIAAQTTFLAVADLAYRRANLEHAAASLENLMHGALLMILLAIPLMAMFGPPVAPLGIHPASLLLVAAYVFGVRMVRYTHTAPLWHPEDTEELRDDVPEPDSGRGDARRLWVTFAVLAGIVAISGYVVAEIGLELVERTGLSETVVGAFITAIATSTPELVTSVAAVRRGALTLAVGGVLGGNAFDVLFLSFADVAFRDGSIYHAIASGQVFIIALTLLMTGTLLLGMLRREREGIANIGFESFVVMVAYVGGLILLVTAS